MMEREELARIVENIARKQAERTAAISRAERDADTIELLVEQLGCSESEACDAAEKAWRPSLRSVAGKDLAVLGVAVAVLVASVLTCVFTHDGLVGATATVLSTVALFVSAACVAELVANASARRGTVAATRRRNAERVLSDRALVRRVKQGTTRASLLNAHALRRPNSAGVQ